MARTYQIFRERERSGTYRAVGTGPCWMAFPLPWAWAFRHRFWLRGGVMLLVDTFLALLVPALASTQAIALLLAFLAPRLVALARGHDWLAGSLEDRGFDYLGRILASGSSDAIAQVARRDGAIPAELRPKSTASAFAFPPTSLQQIWAVARLTVRAAFRYRLVVVLIVLLLGAVAVLPGIIKHDETAQGFTQILLTYTLGIITAILSLVTLWLACGTLARDIDECQMQVVAAKPVPRWQVWLGKWLGIMGLNAILLGVSGGAVYFLMQWRATQLPPELRASLQSNILTARAAVREPAKDLDTDVENLIRERLPELQSKGVNIDQFRTQAREMIKARQQVVPPDHLRRFRLDFRSLAGRLRDQSVFVRFKFHTPELGAKRPYEFEITAGPPETAQRRVAYRSLAAEAQHEIEMGSVVLDPQGMLVVDVANRSDAAIILEEGFEVLYPEGGFGLNFVRAVAVIACGLGLLASIGLAAASFLSFPVAAFLATTVLILGMSTGTLKSVVEDRTVLGMEHDTNRQLYPAIDAIMVPVFAVLLETVNLVQQFSPIDAVSSGRSVTWGDVARAFLLVDGLMGGLFAAVGVIAFTRRELATAQSNH